MITDDKITEIFCLADDFCNLFDELTLNLIKPQREKVHRERLRLFMRKGGWISIRKWKMIHRLQFIELTLYKKSEEPKFSTLNS